MSLLSNATTIGAAIIVAQRASGSKRYGGGLQEKQLQDMVATFGAFIDAEIASVVGAAVPAFEWLDLTNLAVKVGDDRTATFQLKDQNGSNVAKQRLVHCRVLDNLTTEDDAAKYIINSVGTGTVQNGAVAPAQGLVIESDISGVIVFDARDVLSGAGRSWIEVTTLSDGTFLGQKAMFECDFA